MRRFWVQGAYFFLSFPKFSLQVFKEEDEPFRKMIIETELFGSEWFGVRERIGAQFKRYHIEFIEGRKIKTNEFFLAFRCTDYVCCIYIVLIKSIQFDIYFCVRRKCVFIIELNTSHTNKNFISHCYRPNTQRWIRTRKENETGRTHRESNIYIRCNIVYTHVWWSVKKGASKQ